MEDIQRGGRHLKEVEDISRKWKIFQRGGRYLKEVKDISKRWKIFRNRIFKDLTQLASTGSPLQLWAPLLRWLVWN